MTNRLNLLTRYNRLYAAYRNEVYANGLTARASAMYAAFQRLNQVLKETNASYLPGHPINVVSLGH